MAKKKDDDLFAASTMTFGEHLDELRVVLFRSLIGLVIGFILGLFVSKYVVQWIKFPLENALQEHYSAVVDQKLREAYGKEIPDQAREFFQEERLLFEEVYLEQSELNRIAEGSSNDFQAISAESEVASLPLPAPGNRLVKTRMWRKARADVQSLSAQEPFMIWVKAGFFTGLLLASPYIFWQIWSFVAAGLYSHERRYVILFLPISLLLFWSGVAMAFFVVFRFVLKFLFAFNRALDIQTDPRISEWIGFVMFLPLGFGVAFQLPLVMFFLNRIGIVSLHAYLEKWRIALLVIFVLSMLLTPADPMSMLLMATPLTALYFLGIAMAKWMPRGRNPFAETYEP
ncbi:MAG: twin-arginine translocase subunit TatC [Planctomycetota bacterium]